MNTKEIDRIVKRRIAELIDAINDLDRSHHDAAMESMDDQEQLQCLFRLTHSLQLIHDTSADFFFSSTLEDDR